MRAPFEGIVETKAGPAFVRVRGTGPRLLVFHGGPGFDQEPLISGLADLARYRTLIFFDQLGCGRTPASTHPVTAEATFAHAAALIDEMGADPIGLFAHSWGVVAAAGAASLRPEFVFTESLLVSPVALNSGGYDEARAGIGNRVPTEIMQRMLAMLAAGSSGAEAFSLLLPYYVASPETRLPPISVAAEVYASVEASLGAFDYSRAVAAFGPLSVIRGDQDFVAPSTFRALLDLARRDVVLDGVGHYPFFEAPAEFNRAARQILGG